MKWKFWSGQSPDSNFIEKLWNKQNAQKHFSVAKLKQSSIKDRVELLHSDVKDWQWHTWFKTLILYLPGLSFMFCFMIWNIQECEISKNKKSGRGQIFFHSSFILCKWMSKITKPLKWKQAAEPVESMNDGLIHAHTEMLLSFVGFLLWLKKKTWKLEYHLSKRWTALHSWQFMSGALVLDSEPASIVSSKRGGSFITGWRSLLRKWYIGSWQMWVTFSQSDNRHLRIHESDVGGL